MGSSSTMSKQKFVKAAVLVAGAAMTMGNQKCEQKPEARVLKKIVDVSAITSSPINFPDGSSFDFQYVANQQLVGVLQESESFAFKVQKPIATAPVNSTTTSSGDTNLFNLSKMDGAMMKSFSQDAGKSNYKTQYAQTAWCMVNVPQARIAGSVNSFELIGGGGLSVGYTPAGPIPGSPIASGSFDVQAAQLDLSMMAYSPLTASVMAASNVTSKQTKTKVSFTINFGTWSIGPSAYYQTPLATVTKKALQKAVDGLTTQLEDDVWYTRVMANHDTHLVVVGGSDVNLEVGDQLLVYNEEYYWEGEPCNSKYLGGGAAAASAVAKIEIDWVGDEISRGKVIEQNDYNAVIGAKVKLFKMHAADYVPPAAGVQPPSDGTPGPVGQTVAAAPSKGSSAKATGRR